MTDTPESLRALARLLHGYKGVWDLSPAITALEQYAGSLEIQAYRANSRTHAENCWMWHHECAVAKIEQMMGETK